MFPDTARKNNRAWPTLALATGARDKFHTKEAQFLLKNNRHGVVFYKGALDGVFGPEMAEACRRAKLKLGFPDSLVKPTFGGVLRSYLVPRSHPAFLALPKGYAAHAKKRSQVPFRETVLERALREVGYVEQPVNKTKFGKAYGMDGVSWCAIFVSNMIGFQKFKYAYVPYVVADARVKRNGLYIVTDPRPGDLVCFDWPGESPGLADHIGFFGGWLDKAAGKFWTVEGNTSGDDNGSQSNGGGVYRRHDHPRYVSNVEAFVGYH